MNDSRWRGVPLVTDAPASIGAVCAGRFAKRVYGLILG